MPKTLLQISEASLNTEMADPTTYRVRLTEGAKHDLASIITYLDTHEGPAFAHKVLDAIEQVIQELSRFPNRGAHPPELQSIGITDYRQVIERPYRLIYQVRADQVVVFVIADGRRDMQTLLFERLIR